MPSFPVLLDPALRAVWAGLARSGEVQNQIAAEIRTYLMRNGYYPAHDVVANVIDALDLRFRYAPEDVIGPINTILHRASTATYCCVKDADHDAFDSVPLQPWYPNQATNEQVQRALVLSTIENYVHGGKYVIFVSLLKSAGLKFATRVTIVDPDMISGFTPGELPRTLEGSAVVADNFESVIDCFSAEGLWSEASDAKEIKKAIRIRCREKLKAIGAYRSMVDIPEFWVGSDFYSSLTRLQAAGAGRFASVTLEACACAALQLPTLEWKDFDKPARALDGAEPLRAHLTKAGVGLRLMAWKRSENSGGYLEFANVGEKWEEEIGSTDPANAV
jgi:hypothetical protein